MFKPIKSAIFICFYRLLRILPEMRCSREGRGYFWRGHCSQHHQHTFAFAILKMFCQSCEECYILHTSVEKFRIVNTTVVCNAKFCCLFHNCPLKEMPHFILCMKPGWMLVYASKLVTRPNFLLRLSIGFQIGALTSAVWKTTVKHSRNVCSTKDMFSQQNLKR